MLNLNLLYLQHENGTFLDKGSYSKSYLLSPLYKPQKFVIRISEYPVHVLLASHRWGPEFASLSLHVGFMVDETGSGQVFYGVSPVFPHHNFHSTISPHSSHPFRFISSAFVMVHQAWSAGTLATHAPIIQGLHRISSLDPTLCWTQVEDIYFIYKLCIYKR